MRYFVEELPDCRVALRVEIPPEVVVKERGRIIQSFMDKAKIPGFRPGKIPVSVIRKRFNKAIENQMSDRLVKKALRSGIEKENLDVLNVETVDDYQEFEDTVSFVATLQVAPEVDLPDYIGIPVTVPKIDVSEFDIDHQMDHLRERMATFLPVEGRALELGDFAVIDYRAELDGEFLGDAVEAAGQLSEGDGQLLQVVPETFLPGFCDALVGMTPVEFREFEVAITDDFSLASLRGETLTFGVTLLEIKQRVLPEWSDELTGGIEPGLTVAALRQRIRMDIEAHQLQERHELIINQILSQFNEQSNFELPSDVVANETQRQVDRLVNMSYDRGATGEQISQQKQSIIEHAKSQAQAGLKSEFIIRKISEREKIQVTQRDIDSYAALRAKEMGVSVKKFKSEAKRQGSVDDINYSIRRRKTLDFLRERANITEVDRPPHKCDHPDHQDQAAESPESEDDLDQL